MARRGDLIRCTMEKERNGEEFEFIFTLNGRKICRQEGEEKPLTLEKRDGLYPYIAMADGCSVLARVRIAVNLWVRISRPIAKFL